MDLSVVFLGFFVGVMIGLTGIGGAALLTPLLILFWGVRPVMAVGTDLAYAAITKAVGAVIHYQQKTVLPSIAGLLALGSIPAALLGVGVLYWLKRQGGDAAMDSFISRVLGVVLIIVAVALIAQLRRDPNSLSGSTGVSAEPHPWGTSLLTVLLGVGVGWLVGITSVGSGSLIVAGLVVLYPRLPVSVIVGTDIFHAVFLLGAAGLAHLGPGGIDVGILQALLIGSIPGVVLGSKLSNVLPEWVLRPAMAVALGVAGYKLL